MAKTRLKLVSPATVKRTVAPLRRRPNAELRPREHLTEREVEKLIEATKGNRWGQRDCTMILPGLQAWPHGPSEVCGLQWTDVEFEVRHSAPAQSQGRGNSNASVCWVMN